ncbi:MAG: hypothetical protein WBP26_05885 [Candidatus Saccharimonadales bacterium]
MSEMVNYFGYGANRNSRMIAAITGRAASGLAGRAAVLQDFNLCVQNLGQIPNVVVGTAPAPKTPREIIRANWGGDFLSYGIKPAEGGKVAGTIWWLTPEERERIRDWELIDFGWYEDTSGIATTNDGREPLEVVTERLRSSQDVAEVVDGLNYETWLAPAEKFEAIASIARQEYDARNIV